MIAGQARTLIVEGWRFFAHSYAVVNQWQLLALMRRGDIAVKVRDAPLYDRTWQPQDGLFDAQTEQMLKRIEIAAPSESADATLRIVYPFDFSLSHSRRTAVFATLENQVIRKDQMSSLRDYERLQFMAPPSELKIVTPSRWSAEGFHREGFAAKQVAIVPHGIEPSVFHPAPEEREQIRRELRLGERDLVFLSVGSMTQNKGIDVLLKAFAEISRKISHARLILKGLDSLYRSQDLVRKILETLPPEDAQLVVNRSVYFGRAFSHRQTARLYRAADVYVSPYRAEGFNLPVLEAAASGLPIICTGGGATDDFVTDDFAKRIQSRKVSVWVNGQELFGLEPNLQHLTDLMLSAAQDVSWRERAGELGSFHVKSNYTWDHVVAALVENLFD